MHGLEVHALVSQVQDAIDLDERNDLLDPEFSPAQLRFLIQRLYPRLVEIHARYEVMLVQEHLVQVLLIVEGALSLEQLVELVDSFVEGLDILILDGHSELIVEGPVRAHGLGVYLMVLVGLRHHRGGHLDNLAGRDAERELPTGYYTQSVSEIFTLTEIGLL